MHAKVANATGEVKTSFKYTLLKATLAAVAVGYLAYVVKPADMLAAVASAQPAWIVAALLLLPLNVLLESLGWHHLVRPVAPATRWRTAAASLLAGHTLGFVSPAGLGAYAGRAYALPHRRRGMLMALVYTDRLLAMVVGVGMGLIGYGAYVEASPPHPAALWLGVWMLGLVIVLGLSTILLFPRRLYRLLHNLAFIRRFRHRLRFLRRYRTPAMLGLVGLAAIRYAVYTTQFVLLLYAFLPDLSVISAYLGVSAVFFAKYLIPPVTLMDLGIREGAAVFFLAAFGVTQAVAFDAAFLLFCINLLGPALLGVPFVFALQPGQHPGAADVPQPTAS